MGKHLLNDRGLALPVVVMVIAVITILGFTAVGVVQNQQRSTSRFADSQSALGVAEAGIHQYLWHLSENPKFYESDEYDDFISRIHTFENGRYQLQVNRENGVVTIRSTGWLDRDSSNKRTVQVRVRQRQLTDYLFVTGGGKAKGDREDWWISGDVVEGPLHTNGTLYISGKPEFKDVVTYSQKYKPHPNSDPVYVRGEPQQVAPLALPTSSSSLSHLKDQAQADDYYYQGRTCIRLDGSQLLVRNQTGDIQARELPPNGVIYVGGTDPKDNKKSKWGLETGNVFVSGRLAGQLTIAAAGDIYITGKDPTNFDYKAAVDTGGIRYADEQGSDMLGLVAGNCVRILHYGWPGYDEKDKVNVAPEDITIQAVILALNGWFEFEDWNNKPYEERGTIYLIGSIIQNFPGEVCKFSQGKGRLTGYAKHYKHDRRLYHCTPPYFSQVALELSEGWEIVEWKEVVPADS
jgi:type II secretory pathway pseudopilin PulG